MRHERRKNRRVSDRRNYAIRDAIESLYNYIYIPTFNNAIGIRSIRQKYLQGCDENVRIEIIMLALRDANPDCRHMRSLRNFARFIIKKGLVNLRLDFDQEELNSSNF